MRLSRFINFHWTWAKAFHLACALIVTPLLGAPTKEKSSDQLTCSECLAQQEASLREKMRATFEQYQLFLEHFANSEYGSATIAYSNTLKGIHSAYHQRKIVHKMKRDLSDGSIPGTGPAKVPTQEPEPGAPLKD